MTYGGTTPAGWYPDPYHPGSTRYWDGTAWTPYAQAAYASVGGSKPALDLEAGRASARRAATAFVVLGVCSAIVALLYPIVVEDLARIWREILDSGESVGSSSRAGTINAVIQPFSLANFVCFIIILIWIHRATTNARALGRSTTHTPLWAVLGWFIPFLNFVYPFQAVRDLLPADHPLRAKVGTWWGLYLGAGGMLLVSAVVTVATSAPVGLIFAMFSAAMHLGSATIARRIVLAVADSQDAAAGGQPAGGWGPTA